MNILQRIKNLWILSGQTQESIKKSAHQHQNATIITPSPIDELLKQLKKEQNEEEK
jgi:hypothetical protein